MCSWLGVPYPSPSFPSFFPGPTLPLLLLFTMFYFGTAAVLWGWGVRNAFFMSSYWLVESCEIQYWWLIFHY